MERHVTPVNARVLQVVAVAKTERAEAVTREAYSLMKLWQKSLSLLDTLAPSLDLGASLALCGSLIGGFFPKKTQ